MTNTEKVEMIIVKLEKLNNLWWDAEENKNQEALDRHNSLEREIRAEMAEIGIDFDTVGAEYEDMINKLKGYKEEEDKNALWEDKLADLINRTIYKGFIVEYSPVTDKYYCWSLDEELQQLGAGQFDAWADCICHIDTLALTPQFILDRPKIESLIALSEPVLWGHRDCYAIYTTEGCIEDTEEDVTIYWGLNLDGIFDGETYPTASDLSEYDYRDLHNIYAVGDELSCDKVHYLGIVSKG